MLLLNQAFHPDVVASAQVLTDVALSLARDGHGVTVVTSATGYDDPARRFPLREFWNGIDIRRVPAFHAGKGRRWQRALNFGSFLVFCGLRLTLLRKHDVVVAMTSPPLISVLGAIYARLRGARLVMWVLDLNPDEAIAAGWLRDGSYAARVLLALMDLSLRAAARVVVMDRFMRDRVAGRARDASKVITIPPWSHDSEVRFDQEGRRRFRRQHGLDGKFVVMYAGNHSPCHPLDTLLHAARELSADASVAFVFIGGGSQVEKVRRFAEELRLPNVTQLPYQPLSELGATLSAADLHAVALGDAFVGIVHPCKVYNVLRVGSGVLYIGPPESHVSDLAARLPEAVIGSFRHGDVTGVVRYIHDARQGAGGSQRSHSHEVASAYTRASLLPQFVEAITGGAGSHTAGMAAPVEPRANAEVSRVN